MAVIIEECTGCVIYDDDKTIVLDTPLYGELNDYRNLVDENEKIKDGMLVEGLEMLHYYSGGVVNPIRKSELFNGIVESIYVSVVNNAKKIGYRDFYPRESPKIDYLKRVIATLISVSSEGSVMRVPNLMEWDYENCPPETFPEYFDLGGIDLIALHACIKKYLERKSVKKSLVYSYIFKSYFNK